VFADPMRPANMAQFIFLDPAVTERDVQPVRKPTVWRAPCRLRAASIESVTDESCKPNALFCVAGRSLDPAQVA
jgi:hypothetical protein